jgi:hypothetical protein
VDAVDVSRENGQRIGGSCCDVIFECRASTQNMCATHEVSLRMPVCSTPRSQFFEIRVFEFQFVKEVSLADYEQPPNGRNKELQCTHTQLREGTCDGNDEMQREARLEGVSLRLRWVHRGSRPHATRTLIDGRAAYFIPPPGARTTSMMVASFSTLHSWSVRDGFSCLPPWIRRCSFIGTPWRASMSSCNSRRQRR